MRLKTRLISPWLRRLSQSGNGSRPGSIGEDLKDERKPFEILMLSLLKEKAPKKKLPIVRDAQTHPYPKMNKDTLCINNVR